MKIFMSWSGDASHAVATTMRSWLSAMFEAVEEQKVFLSSEDIAKGTAWFSELMRTLEESSFGILCLTRESLQSAWVMFEAGALAKHLAAHEARVIPVLIGIANTDLPSPLSQLNGATLTRADMLRLAHSVNAALGNDGVTDARLVKQFDLTWPELERGLQAAAASATRYDYDAFLSAPMAAFVDEATYQSGRASIKKVFTALTEGCGLRVYWAAEKIETKAQFEALDISADRDLHALERSHYFVLFYPQRLPSSALFEAGYAYALKKPSRYFTPLFPELPFLMRKLPGLRTDASVSIHTADEWPDVDALAALIRNSGRDWFAS